MRMRVECSGPTGQFVVDASERQSEPLIWEDYWEKDDLADLDPDPAEWSGFSRWEAFDGSYAESLTCNYSTVPQEVGCLDCPSFDSSKSWAFLVSHAVWIRENSEMDETDVMGCVQALSNAHVPVGSFEHGTCEGQTEATATVYDYDCPRTYTVSVEFEPYDTPPCDIATTEASCETDNRCSWVPDPCDDYEFGSPAVASTCAEMRARTSRSSRRACARSVRPAVTTQCEPSFTGECTQCVDGDGDADGYAVGSFYCRVTGPSSRKTGPCVGRRASASAPRPTVPRTPSARRKARVPMSLRR